MARAFNGASAIRPFDIGFVADHRLDYAVGALQYPECADQIYLGPHGDARAACVEQASEGRDQLRLLKTGSDSTSSRVAASGTPARQGSALAPEMPRPGDAPAWQGNYPTNPAIC